MELLPCPFCGGKATFDHDDNGWYWIVCEKCGTATNSRTHTMEDCHPLLAEQWNRRASPASAPEGWKFVPVEPTDAMSEAAMSTFIRTSAHETEIDVDVLYHAMLAAAPVPSVSEDRKDAERLNWLDEQGMIAIGHKGYGEYRYYAGDLFPAIRQVIDQARQEDKP